MSETVVARYRHPQGSTIAVYGNGAIVKVNPAGKVVSTSATAEKLAAGHGGWVLVTDDAPAPTPAPRERQAAPARTLLPMKFKQAPVTDLPRFVTDDRWVLQQKLDGIRAQLVFEPGRAPWFRNGTGGRLASDTAAPVAAAVMHLFRGAALPADATGYAVDGEIVGGEFWVFDIVTDGEEDATLADRLFDLDAWYSPLGRSADGSNVVRLLPTARDMDEKHALAEAVHAQGGEGWIAKRLDGGYRWGTRVEHSLKLKITHTVDAVVMDVGRDGKANFVLGVYVDGALTEIGCASAIGKPAAAVGDVLEVKYLYVGADARLVQPTVLRRRTDKSADACDNGQLRFADKSVVTL